MSSSKLTQVVTIISFFFLSHLLFLDEAKATSPLLFHICFNKQNYTANSPFESNLNQLFSSLSIETPPTGFGQNSAGRDSDSQAFGLALCRGDVTSEDCKACVDEAAKGLRGFCPYNKGAVIWYDNCLLKYSDTNFFRTIDMAQRFALLNVKDVEEPEPFNVEVKKFVNGLAYKASASPKLYAIDELNLGVGPDPKLYGLAQCTRDLNGVDCKNCLDQAISFLPKCCSGKRGGRVVTGSCYVRYELYPIVKA